MKASVGRALGQHYGLEMGVQERVGTTLLDRMKLAPEQMDFADRLLPDCWLVTRMDDYFTEVQLSLFLVCDHSSRFAARVRTQGKCGGLSYMRDAKFSVSGGCPLAHCTVCIPKKRGGGVSVSFLEKDRQRRARSLNLGKFLLGVTLRAVAPFVDPDVELTLEAVDSGSGRLIAYYRRLGLEPKAVRGESGRAFETPMVAKMAKVLAMCSRCLAAEPGGGTGTSVGNHGVAANAVPGGQATYKRKRTLEPCAICIEMLPAEEDGENEVTLQCGHRFHTACVQEWLAKVPSCPLCKQAAVSPGRLVPTPCRSRRGPT
jgi:hypothetical protein